MLACIDYGIGGKVRNGILRVQTDQGIEGNCTIGDRSGDADGRSSTIQPKAELSIEPERTP